MTKRAQKSPQKTVANNNLVIKALKPITAHQKDLVNSFDHFNYILSYGSAGTGKTYLSLYLALQLFEKDQGEKYKNIVIIRSIVPTRDIGYLPGNLREKSALYEEPYMQIVNDLYERSDAYEILKQKNIIQFATTTALRGITFKNSIIVVDEMQNMTDHEINSLVTRMGDNVKLLMCGDGAQVDLNPRKEETGFYEFINTVQRMSTVATIKFDTSDIVRSAFVREYILARENIKQPPKGFGDTTPSFIMVKNDDRHLATTTTTTQQ